MRRSVALLVLWLALFATTTIQAQQTPSAPAPAPRASQAKSPAPQEPSTPQGNPDVQVWVNTNSGVYHCPSTRWYGVTKSGVYMKQAEAQQKGYRPAYHRICR